MGVRVVDIWTGARALALCTALRMSYEAFAEKLGRSPSTVNYWRRHPHATVSKDISAELDVLLSRASDVAHELFWRQVDDDANPTSPVDIDQVTPASTALLTTAASDAQLLARPALTGDALTPELLFPLRSMFQQYIQIDQLIGARHMIEPIRQQATFVQQLASIAYGETRTDLLTLATGWAEFCGWALHEAGHLTEAMTWTDRALGHVQELDDSRLRSYVLMRKSNIATDAGHPGAGVGLADAALRYNDLPPLYQAIALRQRANGLALVGDADECARTLDTAMDAATSDNAQEAPAAICNPIYCTPAYVEMEAANCWVQLHQPEKAIPIFEQGLAEWPAGSQERDRGLCLSRLATAHAISGDLEAATEAGIQAATVVVQTRSGRSIAQLGQLKKYLDDARTARGVGSSDFTESLAKLVDANEHG